MEVLAKVAELRGAGREVISLCAGEPSQGAPTAVRERMARLMSDGTPLGYSPALGIRPLREQIAGHYRRWYDLDVDPDQVAITTGSSGAFLLAFLAAFDHGARVAVTRPGYPAYRNTLASLGCDVVDLDCGVETGFRPTLELLEAAGPLDGLVLASPANPTGTMINKERFAELLAWCRDHEVRVVSDEIYHGISYTDSVGTCARSLDESAIVVSSFSKYWGMTGWRLGWMLLDPVLLRAVDALAGNLALCPPVPAQYAALGAFEESAYAEAAAGVSEYAAARQLILDALPDLGWGGVAPADGAFYLYADITDQLGKYVDSTAWCSALLDSHGVAITPGLDFDPVGGRHTVRLSLAAGAAAIKAAVERTLDFQSRG